jgi:hypothetical protein
MSLLLNTLAMAPPPQPAPGNVGQPGSASTTPRAPKPSASAAGTPGAAPSAPDEGAAASALPRRAAAPPSVVAGVWPQFASTVAADQAKGDALSMAESMKGLRKPAAESPSRQRRTQADAQPPTQTPEQRAAIAQTYARNHAEAWAQVDTAIEHFSQPPVTPDESQHRRFCAIA